MSLSSQYKELKKLVPKKGSLFWVTEIPELGSW